MFAFICGALFAYVVHTLSTVFADEPAQPDLPSCRRS